MATHSSIPAWRIPWTEELDGGYSPRGRKGSDTTEQLHFKYTYGILAFPISPPKGNRTEWVHTHTHTHTHTHRHPLTHRYTQGSSDSAYFFGSEFAVCQSRVFIFMEIKGALTFPGSFALSESCILNVSIKRKFRPTVSNLMPDTQLEAEVFFPRPVKVTKGFSLVDVFIYSSCASFYWNGQGIDSWK